MATLPEHVKSLLFEQNCVVIPDFGGFITNFQPADVRNGAFYPPSRKLVFNEVLRFDDGLLANFISQKEGLSRDEAYAKIQSFSHHLKTELRRRGYFRFDSIGTFTNNNEGKLVFEPDEKQNFHAESFGFKGVVIHHSIKAVVIEEVVEEKVEEIITERQSSWYGRAAAMAGFAFMGLAGLSVYLQNKTGFTSSFNPFSTVNFTEASQPNSSNVSKYVSNLPLKTVETTVIETSKERYYIVAAGFEKHSNAALFQSNISSKGETTDLLLPKGSKLTKVVVGGTFETMDAASQKMKSLYKNFGTNLWILKVTQ